MSSPMLYNLDIERAILSAIIFEPEQYENINGLIRVSDFYLPFHSYLFMVISELYEEEKPIEETFIEQRLRKISKFDESAFMDVLSTNPITNVDAYVQNIIELSKLRLLSRLGSELKKMAIEDEEDSETIVSACSKELENISDLGVLEEVDSVSNIVKSTVAKINEAAKFKDIYGYKSGITTLDIKIGAFEPGKLIIIAARPSMGKTSLAVNIIEHNLQKGHGVLFDSLEMDRYDIMRRFLAFKSLESIEDFKRGAVKNPKNFKEAQDFFSSSQLHIHDKSMLTVDQIKAKALRTFRKHPNIKLWILDHLRYIKLKGNDTAGELSTVMKELKRVAKENGVTLFALSQINRQFEQRVNKKPQLTDLRDSGSLEEDADMVLMLHRDSYYQRAQNENEAPVNPAEIIVMKNRDGRTGVCKCYFDGPRSTFLNYVSTTHQDYEHHEEIK